MRQWIPSHSRADVEDAVANSPSLSGALRRLGLRVAGANFRTLRKLIDHYEISTEHFDPNWTLRSHHRHSARPLAEILINSSYGRDKLKRRLYQEGLKSPRCEMCGQGEVWNGREMSLILDHINGTGDDNRLENLQIVCPNCAATLDTHCGRKNKAHVLPRACLRCGAEFRPNYLTHRYCSQACGSRSSSGHNPHPRTRKVERPPYAQLMAELAASNWSAVARRYGVSDNAVRKWVRWYEADAERRAARAFRQRAGRRATLPADQA